MDSLIPVYLLELVLINQIAVACKTTQFVFDLSDECRTPIMYWQMLTHRIASKRSQILRYLVKNTDTWSIYKLRFRGAREHYDVMSDLLQSDDLLCSESGADVANNSVS
jgi:hypothetical protein